MAGKKTAVLDEERDNPHGDRTTVTPECLRMSRAFPTAPETRTIDERDEEEDQEDKPFPHR